MNIAHKGKLRFQVGFLRRPGLNRVFTSVDLTGLFSPVANHANLNRITAGKVDLSSSSTACALGKANERPVRSTKASHEAKSGASLNGAKWIFNQILL
jgi:hypothetical protein